MNLENSIKDCIAKELEKGIVEKVIAAKLEECVASSLKDMFSWNGEVKKVIDEKVKSVMIPYLESYDYSQYITKLDNVLVDVLKNSSLENKKLLENFKELMIAEESLKEIKLTDIYKKWQEYCEKTIDKDKIPGYEYEGGYINTSLEVEEVSSSWSDFEKHVVRFECEEDEDLNVEFMLTRWKDISKEHNVRYDENSDINSLRRLNVFDMYMMKINQAYSKIEIDDYSSNDEIFIEYEG